VEKRLLVKDTRDGQTVVEVALESLLRQWRELAACCATRLRTLKTPASIERGRSRTGKPANRDGSLAAGYGNPPARSRNPLPTKPELSADRLDPTSDVPPSVKASRRAKTTALRQNSKNASLSL
jgi:hypothetical protein